MTKVYLLPHQSADYVPGSGFVAVSAAVVAEEEEATA
jgi:hypothetical protein